MSAPARVPVAVLGASGYSGGELVRLFSGHPAAEIAYLGANESAGRTLGEVHPYLRHTAHGETTLEPLDAAAVTARASIVFCALPNGSSSAPEVVPALMEAGARVIDLAGDFRLPAEDYPAWYGFEHPAPEWLDKSVYGLPELFGTQVAGASLVANPGCYPTPVILGLAPLLAAGLVEPGNVLVDGKTGLSGAGRGASEASSYASTEESVRPYRFPGHQHTPEMERGLEMGSGGPAPTVSFVPHLVPSVRGVLTTCYAPLASGVTTDQLTECLSARYSNSPFVRVLSAGEMADTKRTRGTNVVELQAVADPRTGQAIVVGALDNLVKGAAGQAIQNMNLMLGLDEGTGLPTTAVYP